MTTKNTPNNDRFANLPSKVQKAIAVIKDQAKVKKGYAAQDFKIMLDARSKLARLRAELDDNAIIAEVCPEALEDVKSITDFENIINELKDELKDELKVEAIATQSENPKQSKIDNLIETIAELEQDIQNAGNPQPLTLGASIQSKRLDRLKHLNIRLQEIQAIAPIAPQSPQVEQEAQPVPCEVETPYKVMIQLSMISYVQLVRYTPEALQPMQSSLV